MFDILAQQVWLAPGATDMRKSIDGLSAMAQYALGQNPLQPHSLNGRSRIWCSCYRGMLPCATGMRPWNWQRNAYLRQLSQNSPFIVGAKGTLCRLRPHIAHV